jgi:K+-sensing histidine kinase KdpD
VLARDADANLLVVHVVAARPRHLDGRVVSHRELTTDLGGRYVEQVADSAVDELVHIATKEQAATVVVGGHRSWISELMHGFVPARLGRRLPDAAVVEVAEPRALPEERNDQPRTRAI